jgi:hypothetical protein
VRYYYTLVLPIQHLLVPLSGAPFAERALPYAERVAGLKGAAITLAHVEPGSGPRVGELVGEVVDALTGRQTAPPESVASVVSGLRELEERGCTDLVVLAECCVNARAPVALMCVAGSMALGCHAEVKITACASHCDHETKPEWCLVGSMRHLWPVVSNAHQGGGYH